MSEKKKIKWKLNLFDTGLIAVVLIAGAVLVMMKLGGSSPAPVDPNAGAPAAMDSVRYVVQLEQLHLETAKLAAAGDTLYERTKKELMGTVESVDIAPARTLTKNELEGTFQFAEVPDRYDLTMTVTAPASENDGAIIVSGGFEVRAGTSVRVLGPGYYGAGYIISVERG